MLLSERFKFERVRVTFHNSSFIIVTLILIVRTKTTEDWHTSNVTALPLSCSILPAFVFREAISSS